MQGIHERNVDKRRRPQHGCRLDEPPSDRTSKTETKTLRRDSEEDVEAPAKRRQVVELLDCDNGVDEVSRTTTKSSISHSNNDDMLFDVEWSRIEVHLVAKQRHFVVRHDLSPTDTHRVCDQLYDVRSNGNDGEAEEEERIDTTADGGKNEADSPCADRADGNILIVVANDSTNLRVV